MSIQPAALPAPAGQGEAADLAARMPTGTDAARVRDQAADIIREVLSGTRPDQAGARKALREQCAAHPGHPETALVEHLLAIRGITVPPPLHRIRGAGGAVTDNDDPAVEDAAARLHSPDRNGQNLARLHSNGAAASTHGKPAREIVRAAHLTALEAADAVDAITHPGPVSPAPRARTLNAPLPRAPEDPLATASPDLRQDAVEYANANTPGAWRLPRDGDRTWVSHRPSPGGPARSFWLTHRTAKTTDQEQR